MKIKNLSITLILLSIIFFIPQVTMAGDPGSACATSADCSPSIPYTIFHPDPGICVHNTYSCVSNVCVEGSSANSDNSAGNGFNGIGKICCAGNPVNLTCSGYAPITSVNRYCDPNSLNDLMYGADPSNPSGACINLSSSAPNPAWPNCGGNYMSCPQNVSPAPLPATYGGYCTGYVPATCPIVINPPPPPPPPPPLPTTDCFMNFSACDPGFYCDPGGGWVCQYSGYAGICGQNAQNSWAGTIFPYDASSYYTGSDSYYCQSGTPAVPDKTTIPFPAQGGTATWTCPGYDPLGIGGAYFADATCTARRASPPAMADLSISNISPTSAVITGNVIFGGKVNNFGGASAPATQTRIQIDLNSNGWTAGEPQLTFATNALGIGASSLPNPTWSVSVPAGTHQYQICADSSNVVTESDESNNCSAWQSLVVSALPQPDLTLTNVSITTSPVVAGNSINFSGTVSNTGSANAAASQTQLQIDTDNSGTWTSGEPQTTVPTSALAGSTNEVDTLSLTLSSGTYGYRICADSGNAVTESNEANNCSTWTPFTVSAVPVNGSCGTAAKAYTSGATSYNVPPDTYCATGIASPVSPGFPAQGASTPWTCQGQGGGTNASCSASRAAAPIQRGITVNVNTAGQGTVVVPRPSQSDLNCTASCTVQYDTGTQVTLTATPLANRIFSGWIGCDSILTNTTSGGTCRMTADADKSVTAKFSINPNFKEF